MPKLDSPLPHMFARSFELITLEDKMDKMPGAGFARPTAAAAIAAESGLPRDCGLTQSDIAALQQGCAKLPGKWRVDLEREDDECLYARITAPWIHDLSSSFLVDRVGEVVVLTDRVSSLTDDLASWHPTVGDALEAIQNIVFGQTRELAATLDAPLVCSSE
jgi:hypothetical protein